MQDNLQGGTTVCVANVRVAVVDQKDGNAIVKCSVVQIALHMLLGMAYMTVLLCSSILLYCKTQVTPIYVIFISSSPTKIKTDLLTFYIFVHRHE